MLALNAISSFDQLSQTMNMFLPDVCAIQPSPASSTLCPALGGWSDRLCYLLSCPPVSSWVATTGSLRRAGIWRQEGKPPAFHKVISGGLRSWLFSETFFNNLFPILVPVPSFSQLSYWLRSGRSSVLLTWVPLWARVVSKTFHTPVISPFVNKACLNDAHLNTAAPISCWDPDA